MTSQASLDDPRSLEALDPSSMLEVVGKSPSFMRWCLENHLVNPSTSVKERITTFVGKMLGDKMNFAGVFVAGMGGSAISGDLLHDWLIDVSPVPIVVLRDYQLPAHVDKDWLGIFLSYSGNTEETLSTYIDAKRKGIPAIAITSGGRLKEFATLASDAIVTIPGGHQPRAALFYLFTSLAITAALLKLGESDKLIDELEECVDVLQKLSKELSINVPTRDNLAKQHAQQLRGTTVLIYGFGHLASVARRCKGQFNENGKNPAYHDAFPELNHNEIVGWEAQNSMTESFSCMFLRDPAFESPAIETRIDYTMEVVKKKARQVLELHPRGKGKLARMLSMVHCADHASVYLAVLNGADPTPVSYIEGLKGVLEEKVGVQASLKRELQQILGEGTK